MPIHIQNRHTFAPDVRASLDGLAGEEWEYSSVEEAPLSDGSLEIRYVIHDAAGNELCTVVARSRSGQEVQYTVVP